MKEFLIVALPFFLLSGCAPHNFPDSVDKNNVPSELEVGRNEELDIPDADDEPGVQNPLEEQNPSLYYRQ